MKRSREIKASKYAKPFIMPIRIMSWQTMDSAPHDQTHVLLALLDGEVVAGKWDCARDQNGEDDWDYEGWWSLDGEDLSQSMEPVYWMPYPRGMSSADKEIILAQRNL